MSSHRAAAAAANAAAAADAKCITICVCIRCADGTSNESIMKVMKNVMNWLKRKYEFKVRRVNRHIFRITGQTNHVKELIMQTNVPHRIKSVDVAFIHKPSYKSHVRALEASHENAQ